MVSLGDNCFGADISSFAGAPAQLTILNAAPFYAPWSPDWFGRQTSTIVDQIVFSPIAIPEPSSFVLFAAALGSIALRPTRAQLRRPNAFG
jgi:hypothetical protein